MLPTPTTSHVSFDTVYEPAEDSFLLLDTLSSSAETAWLSSRLGSASPGSTHRTTITPLVVELGTGSGVVIAFLAAHATRICGGPVLALGMDVNRNACIATAETVRKAIHEQQQQQQFDDHWTGASVSLGSQTANLASCLVPNSVDILVFNPPYVPTESVPQLHQDDEVARTAFERDSHLLSLSYAGGKDGMETTNQFLASLPSVLSSRGVAYLLLCAQNRPDEVKERIRRWEGDDEGRGVKPTWHAETVGHSGKKAGWEKLEVIRIWERVA